MLSDLDLRGCFIVFLVIMFKVLLARVDPLLLLRQVVNLEDSIGKLDLIIASALELRV